ncbi:MAG: DUF1385 domain-containing protein [Fimbriimonadales bacterium]
MPKGEYLQYGGQAIIEGVMMRSPKHFAIACRAPNGKIVLQAEPLAKTWIGRQKWLKAPFLRGTLALLDAMALGIRAMNFSSNVQLDPQYEADGIKPSILGEELAASATAGVPPTPVVPHATESAPVEIVTNGEPQPAEMSTEGSTIVRPQAKGGGSLMKAAVVGTMIFGLGMGVLLFVATPVWIAQLFTNFGIKTTFGLNVVEGIVKAVIFIGYLALIGLMKDIQEVFKYHGAEHKAINALEAEQELTLENARAQTRLHPRCGTSFAIIVLLISIVAFTLLPRDYNTGSTALDLLVRIGLKLMILPLIAGISYEAIRFAGKFRSEKWVMALFWPGLKSQLLTTREPEDKHLEVALVALKSVLQQEDATKKVAEPESVLA